MRMKERLRGLALQEYKKKLILTTTQKEILFGTLLGDASIPKKYRGVEMKNVFVKFEQSIKNKLYIEHLYNSFKEWVGSPPYTRVILGGGASMRKSIGFRTYSHQELFSFYSEFYSNSGGKIVPKKLENRLTPRALAYWYMDDGSYIKSNNNYYLNTQCFRLEDLLRLQISLADQCGLKTKLHKDKNSFRIYIISDSVEPFVEMVQPYILETFRRKFHPKYFTLT